MNNQEKQIVKLVAKLAPWLAPFPSAFFVARSAMVHLALPLPVAVVVAAILEFLGLATVHTALWAHDWNAQKRKTDPSAPTALAVALGVVYLVATLGLVVFLEVWPVLATYAPALFPVLAVVGALNLAMIAQQERREAAVEAQKAEAREKRRARRVSRRLSKTGVQGASKTRVLEPSSVSARSGSLDAQDRVYHVQQDVQGLHALQAVNVSKQERKAAMLDALLDIYADDPGAGATRISRQLGIGRSTVYHYLGELEAAGRVRKNGHGVEVLTVREGAS
jgi:hypothetical protein